MERPRPVPPRPPPPPNPTPRLPSLAELGLDDAAAPFDPDWYPSVLAPFSSPPSRWRVLRRLLGVGAGLIAVVAIALLSLLLSQEEPDGDDVGRLPAGNVPVLPAASPTVIPAGVGGNADPVADVPKTVRRGGDNHYVAPTVAPTAVPTRPPVDDPVLYWLPEILAAAAETGVSPSLIAGMIHVESQGEFLATSPHGARGLMQMMPEQLAAQGVPEHRWHDPATNILAGARLLGWHIETYGTTWDGVAHYFGIGCDGFSCTDAYVSDVLRWEAYYAELIVAPRSATPLAVSAVSG